MGGRPVIELKCAACGKGPDQVRLRSRRKIPICDACVGICIRCKIRASSIKDVLCPQCGVDLDRFLDDNAVALPCIQAEMSDHAKHAPHSRITGKPYGRNEAAMGFDEFRNEQE